MMAGMITPILIGLLRGIRTHRALVLENLALRHQLAVQRSAPRLRLRRSDRLFWVLLSRLWSGWSDGLHCPTRHRHSLAAVRLQALLDLEEPTERARPSGCRPGDPRSSDGCPRPTPCGARRGFTGSFRN
jgi:hypothetical protein